MARLSNAKTVMPRDLSRERDEIRELVVKYLDSQQAALYGRPFDLFQKDSKELAVDWLTDQVVAVLSGDGNVAVIR